jgi:mannose-6-phosphate isomerase-like protein (cupin superfamily)
VLVSRAAQVVDAGSLSSPEGVPTVGPSTGFMPLEQAVIHLEPGQRCARCSGACEEVLFVLAGQGALELAGERFALEPESGAYLAPGEEYSLECAGPEPLRLIHVRVPDPEPAPAAGERCVVRRLAEQEAQAATTDREFRIVADPSSGLRSATHFVGYIPVVRAPEHFHTYDEVMYILDGQGVFHAEGRHDAVAPGSCIQLPARTVHCLENTGPEMMRVVAVFRPAGSPAAAYYPDGTPAFPGTPPSDVFHEEEVNQ